MQLGNFVTGPVEDQKVLRGVGRAGRQRHGDRDDAQDRKTLQYGAPFGAHPESPYMVIGGEAPYLSI